MADELARGVIALEGDSTSLEASLAKAGSKVKEFEKTATGAAKKVASAQKEQAKAFNDAGEQMTATQARLQRMIARQADRLTSPTQSAYLQKLAERTGVLGASEADLARIRASEKTVTNLGLSAKQTAAAMRLLPAQITDIVTGLISGQPAYLVAIQQGGQLKDSFGGIVPLFKVFAGLLTPVRLAIGGIASVIGLTAYGFFKGSRETDRYNEALVLTGNIAGVTAGQLNVMAREVAKISGTQGNAADIITQLVGTGDVSTPDLTRIATSISRITRITKLEIEDMVKAASELGRDPVKASEKLNEQYRYLTLATYAQIRAYEEQGRTAEAARLAQQAFFDEANSRAEKLEERLGYLARAWNFLKELLSKGLDFTANLGRPSTAREELAKAEEKLALLERKSARGLFPESIVRTPGLAEARERVASLREQAQLEERAAFNAGESQRIQQRMISGFKENAKWTDEAKSKQQKYNEALNRYREIEDLIAKNDPARAKSASQRAREEAAIRLSIFGKGSTKTDKDDEATKRLARARDMRAVLEEQLEAEEKLGVAARALAKFEAEVADLKEKKVLTAAQKELLAGEAKVRAALEYNVELEKAVALNKLIFDLTEKEAKALEKWSDYVANMREEMDRTFASRQEQRNREFEGIGTGTANQRRIQEQNDLYRESDRQLTRLRKQTPDFLLGSDKYKAEVDAIKENLRRALAAHEEYYDRVKRAQMDFNLGASQALNNYLDKVNNTSSAAEEAFTNAFQSLEDAFTDFLTTGKLNFKDFVNSIIADINRIIIRQQITGPLAKALGGGGGDGGLLGGLFKHMFPSPAASYSSDLYTAGVDYGAFFARGAAFGRHGVEKFADGDVVARPTAFGFGSGRVGVMGEAGYEGVLPLSRGADGKLGVNASGAATPQVTNINFVVHAADAGSFLRAESQVQASVARAAMRGRRNM